jgi:hypothetical protein
MQQQRVSSGIGVARRLAPVAFALTLASTGATAAFISFTGFSAQGPGTNDDLSAQADFTTNDGLLTVVLTNLLGADIIRSAGQALSDVSFDLSDDVGTVGTLTAAGQFGDVDPSTGGTVTYVATDTQTGDTTPVRWLTSSNTVIGGTHIVLEAIGGGQPSQMIGPFVANGGAYSNVNAGFDNFNSYVIGPGTFTLQLSGVTANTTISNVQFSFGTGPDTFVPGVPVPQPAPEPGTLAVLAIGLLALAASRRKTR